MKIRKAVVPLAGLATRLYPVSTVIPKGLLPFPAPDGNLKAGVHLILESLIASGFEQVALVVQPETLPLYQRYFSGYPERYAPFFEVKPYLQALQQELTQVAQRITCVVQEQPYGLGHAVWCARDFAQAEPVMVVLGDHLFVEKEGQPLCIRQVLDAFEDFQKSVVGVHQVSSQDCCRYGILKGVPTSHPRFYEVMALMEKPSVEEAQRHLRTPSLPEGRFLAHGGLFAFTSTLWTVMEQIAAEFKPTEGEWQLTTVEQRLLQQEGCYALEIAGQVLDFGSPEGYRLTLLYLAGNPR